MKRLWFIVTSIALLSSAAIAETITTKVNGLVCAFCVQGVKHKLKENAAVDEVNFYLDAGLVIIATKDDQNISDADIKTTITNAGFTVEKIERK